MAPNDERPASPPQRHFPNGSYDITPKYLRRFRKALGIPATTLSIINSLFGYAGKNLEAYPSLKVLAEQADKSVSTVGWHVKFLHAHGLLPIRHDNREDGTRRSIYSLSVLRDLNGQVMDAVREERALPVMFTASFKEWRDVEREKQKGGKRGRNRVSAAPKRGFGVPRYDIDEFQEQELPRDEAEFEQVASEPVFPTAPSTELQDSVPSTTSRPNVPSTENGATISGQRLSDSAGCDAMVHQQEASMPIELDPLPHWVQDIRKAVRGIPREYEWVRETLRLSDEDFARAVAVGNARDEVFTIDLDGRRFLFGRSLDPANGDDAQVLDILHESLRCGPEDLPEELKDHERLVDTVQERVIPSVSKYAIRPSVFAAMFSREAVVALRDMLLADGVPPHIVLSRLVGEVAQRCKQGAPTVEDARRADQFELRVLLDRQRQATEGLPRSVTP